MSTRPGAASLLIRNRSGPRAELIGLSSHFWRATAGRSVAASAVCADVTPGTTLTSWMTLGGIRTGTGTGPTAPAWAAGSAATWAVVGACTVRYRLLTLLRMYHRPLPASSKEKSCAAVPSAGGSHHGAPGAGPASLAPRHRRPGADRGLGRPDGRD